MASVGSRRALRELLKRGEDHLDVAYASLLLAQEEYPALSASSYLHQLDRWGAMARANIGASCNPHVMIHQLNHTLFEELGLKGDVETYHDPRNSYLHLVMDRRRGIPLTLSIIYMAVAERARFPLRGVGLPGHFIVKHDQGGVPIFIDPFHGGALLTVSRCQALVRRIHGEEVGWDPRWLDPVSKVDMLIRLLRNLKRAYLGLGRPLQALSVVERLLILDPRQRGEQHEFARLHALLN